MSASNKRILIVDDQEEIIQAYRSILEQKKSDKRFDIDELEASLFDDELDGEPVKKDDSSEFYDVDSADQGLKGIDLVRTAVSEGRPYAVVFVDMRMPPGIDGKETAKRIREIDKEIEIVIVTAYSDHDRKEIIDYVGEPSRILFLKKPFDVDEIKQLALALTEKWNLNKEKHRAEKKLIEYNQRLEEIVEQKTAELKKTIEKLEILSVTDPMTGLYNYRKFREHLQFEIERLKRFEEKRKFQCYPFSVAIIDLDDFKVINDNYGHLKGDYILKVTADILKETCRSIDIISRYGGDEFVIVFIDCDMQNAFLICERIKNKLSQTVIMTDLLEGRNTPLKSKVIEEMKDQSKNEYFPIKCSIGITQYNGQQNPDQLVSEADSALYEVKKSGKNEIKIYHHY